MAGVPGDLLDKVDENPAQRDVAVAGHIGQRELAEDRPDPLPDLGVYSSSIQPVRVESVESTVRCMEAARRSHAK